MKTYNMYETITGGILGVSEATEESNFPSESPPASESFISLPVRTLLDCVWGELVGRGVGGGVVDVNEDTDAEI